MIGTILERCYRVTAVLGEGNLGKSYAGTHVKTGAPVVVKLLGRGLSADPRARGRFLAAVAMQRDLAGRAHSPELLAAKVDEQVGAPVYLIRGFVRGFTLRQTFGQAQPVPLDVTLEIVGGLLDYLEELETRGFRHGGLVPENVVLTEDGGIGILDPGLSLHLVAPGFPVPPELEPRQEFIAPGYREPPYFEDLRGDLYSVARLARELLAPIAAKGAVDAARQASRVSEAVLAKALAVDPADRFGAVAPMREALRSCLGSGPLVAAPAPPAAEPAGSDVPTPDELGRLAAGLKDADYYDLLGVPPGASLPEIQRRYYQLLARYHPERAQMPGLAAARDQLVAVSNRVNEVYATLRDPIARASYDERRTYRLAGRVPAEPRADDGGIDGADDGEDGIIEDERPASEEAPRRGAFARLFRRRRGSGA